MLLYKIKVLIDRSDLNLFVNNNTDCAYLSEKTADPANAPPLSCSKHRISYNYYSTSVPYTCSLNTITPVDMEGDTFFFIYGVNVAVKTLTFDMSILDVMIMPLTLVIQLLYIAAISRSYHVYVNC